MINSDTSQNWITVIIILLISFLVLLHYLYKKRFLKFISIVKNNEYFVDYINKKDSFISFFNGILFVFQLGVYSLLIFLIKMNFFNSGNDILFFFRILTSLVLFLIGRYLAGKIISYIFGIDKIQGVLSFVKFTYFSKATIYSLPFLILVCYIPQYTKGFLFFTSGLILVMLLYFYGKLLMQNQKLIFRNLFYFILYLCTLEIIPLVYLYKTIF